MSLIGKDVSPFPRLPNIPAWNTLTPEQQKLSAWKMEIYAAMLANMDYHIGRVLEHLKAIGKLENTVVIFFSDNGAEAVELEQLVEKAFSPEAKEWMKKTFDTRPESWGKKGSIVDYGAAWAQVGSVPFRFFKAYVSEGGIRSPLIIAGLGVQQSGVVNQGGAACDRHRSDPARSCRSCAPVQKTRQQARTIAGRIVTTVACRQRAGSPHRQRLAWLGVVR
jgi:arylsulfatase